MLRSKDIRYARKRKKVWDAFKWVYASETQLSKRHSLKCNCSMCKAMTAIKRQNNRKGRYSQKRELISLLKDI